MYHCKPKGFVEWLLLSTVMVFDAASPPATLWDPLNTTGLVAVLNDCSHPASSRGDDHL